MPYKDKELRSQYSKQLRVKQKKFLGELKKAPCYDCGKKYPHFVMEFDHVPERGVKKFSPSSHGLTLTGPQFIEELEKCDVVCANCHRERTHMRRYASPD